MTECGESYPGVREDFGSIPKLWNAAWMHVAGADIRGARGLSVSISAPEHDGRLAARVFYTSRPEQYIEIDFQRAVTLWLPGDRANVYARLENPVDSNPPAVTVSQTGSVVLGTAIQAATTGAQRNLHRTYCFADPNGADTIAIPIPRGAVDVVWIPSRDVADNVATVQAVYKLSDVPTYQALAEYPPRFAPIPAAIPGGAQCILVTGAGGASVAGMMHTLQFGIQPLLTVSNHGLL